ncbi:MAG: rRNA cytosine-C5-methyltransferase [Duncaniella sp.]|nr:rRNA cytosine-C5-methyltransferase [Duncaniella sp.]
MSAAAITLPPQFCSEMSRLGLDDLPAALAAGEQPVSVRLNAAKGGASFEGAEPVEWCAEGLYLPERPQFTLDPRLHQGLYYVQEASSMFHALMVRSLTGDAMRPLRVLDACAAPGGKTTAVLSALPSGSIVVANEYVPARAAVLRENLVKWGSPDVIVTRGDTASFRPMREAFDMIVADVPCSGEGMMRKDPRAAEQWSTALVRECMERQCEILDNLWPSLRPGGWLIYSTCTFNRDENENMVERLIERYGAESVEVAVDPAWGITPGIATEAHCYRFIPGRTRGEGLFAAALRKPGILPEKEQEPSRRKDKKRGKTSAAAIDMSEWIEGADNYTTLITDERFTAFPTRHLDLLRRVSERVDVIYEGVSLAAVKGRDLIPAHPLALSTALRSERFPEAALDADTALAYLRGEAIEMPQGTPCGYVAVTFEGHPLGWVKNLGRRSNNLYPPHYRIKFK